MIAESIRRESLCAFLRSRRARVPPEALGFTGGGRRRSAGLRREEVAIGAGMSVTWYTWLEQGRPIQVSEATLASLARTLQCSPAETRYLYTLAGLEPARSVDDPPIGDHLHAILAALHPLPAFVMGACWDILAWNAAAAYVFGDFGALPPEERNVLWLVFTEQSLCRFVQHPEAQARRVVAEFRSSTAVYLGDPRLHHLLRRLHARSPLFQQCWADHDVVERTPGQKVIDHPAAGPMRFTYTTLHVAETPALRLVVYTPDPATKAMIMASGEHMARF